MATAVKKSLEIVVFVCGACVMVLELVGSRLMAPYLGTSLFVWTSLIGVILGCLSLGYWLGGLLADKKPHPRTLASLLFFAGLCVGAVALAGDALLYVIQSTLPDIRIGAMLATLILFGAPSVLLGMVSPYAIRLKISHVEKTGSTAGKLYALSTLGSIAGTFLAGFWLLSYFGHREVLFMISLTLLALGALTQGGVPAARYAIAFAAVLGASFTPSFVHAVMGEGLHDIPTAYNRVWVYDAFLEGKPVRVLQLNDSTDSAMFVPDGALALEYTKFFRLAGHFRPDLKKALMIGGGSYSYPKYFLKEFPEASMDVVEIDPKLTRVAEEYFELKKDARLRVTHEDARTFLNRSGGSYDVIFSDVYKSRSMPFHLTTREAVQKMSERLNGNGLMLINVISSVEGDNGRFLRAFLAALDEFFPQIYVYAVDDPEDGLKLQNLMVVAFKTKQKRAMSSTDAVLSRHLSHIWVGKIPRDLPPLTDALAPVDRYISGWVTHNDRTRNNILQKKLQNR